MRHCAYLSLNMYTSLIEYSWPRPLTYASMMRLPPRVSSATHAPTTWRNVVLGRVQTNLVQLRLVAATRRDLESRFVSHYDVDEPHFGQRWPIRRSTGRYVTRNPVWIVGRNERSKSRTLNNALLKLITEHKYLQFYVVVPAFGRNWVYYMLCFVWYNLLLCGCP